MNVKPLELHRETQICFACSVSDRDCSWLESQHSQSLENAELLVRCFAHFKPSVKVRIYFVARFIDQRGDTHFAATGTTEQEALQMLHQITPLSYQQYARNPIIRNKVK